MPTHQSHLDGSDSNLQRCQEKLHYTFSDVELLRSALTHASGAEHRLASNERLEFLGDAILGVNICEVLYRRFPDYLEGDLTRIKSIVVSRHVCAKISEKLELSQFLIVGKGMAGSAYPASVLSDVLEALIAAVFLDGGPSAATEFITRHVVPEIDAALEGLGGNYKSELQQLSQRQFGSTPVYHLIDEQGPDHSKCFRIAAQVSGQRYSPAWGRNKKEAEQRAACNALSEMCEEDPPFGENSIGQ